MDSKEALELINILQHKKYNSILSNIEQEVFLGIWASKSYAEIGATTTYTEQYIREVGSNLCRKIEEFLDIRVNKRIFKQSIEYKLKQYTEQNLAQFNAEVAQQKSSLPDRESEKLIINPFIPLQGRVDDIQLFFDRTREIKGVFEILNSGSSVALIGEEGIGKTSLLWAILQQADKYLLLQRQAVFLDLNYIHNEDDFYSALCDEVGISVSKGYQLKRNLKPHKILLAIDNVGKMTWEGFTRQVRDQLRGLAEGSDASLRLVLAASEPLDKLFNDSQEQGKTSPLKGICLEEEIKPWNEATIRDFIQTRLSKTSVHFTEEEIIELVRESGGHPRKLMQLCHKTYARYVEGIQ